MTEPTPDHDPQGLELARQIARAARGGAPRPAARNRKPARRTDEPTRIGEVMAEVIDDQGWTREVNVHQLLARWPALVGPDLAEHSKPVSYTDTVLKISAESTSWAAALREFAPRLVAILNKELGQGTVSRVVVEGPGAPNWKKGNRSVQGRGPRDTYG